MSGIQDRLSDELDSLKRLRDELRVQLQLGKQEARDAWERTEKSWHSLEGRLNRVGRQSKESLEGVEEAAKLLMQEIREGYRRIKELL